MSRESRLRRVGGMVTVAHYYRVDLSMQCRYLEISFSIQLMVCVFLDQFSYSGNIHSFIQQIEYKQHVIRLDNCRMMLSIYHRVRSLYARRSGTLDVQRR